MTASPLIVLAAGGTGGHVFPAQALAEVLLARGRRLALITDRRGTAYGGALGSLETHRIRAGTVSGAGLATKVAGLGRLGIGFWEARRLVATLKPGAVVGFGGYPSLPTMLAAARTRVPTLVHEQNAVLGRVNRLLAPRATMIATSFAETRALERGDRAKALLTGNPVRAEVQALRDRAYAPPGSGGPIRVLVTGGSQGATSLSRVVPAALAALDDRLRARLVVTQQCRAEDLDGVRARYTAAGIDARLAAFLDDLPDRLGEAHLVVARAGASTVSELTVAGRPAILVPYPHATDRHQSRNAEAFVAAGGGWLFEEEAFTAEALSTQLDEVLAAPEVLARAAGAARAAGHPDAAERLADLAERLCPANGDAETPTERAA